MTSTPGSPLLRVRRRIIYLLVLAVFIVAIPAIVHIGWDHKIRQDVQADIEFHVLNIRESQEAMLTIDEILLWETDTPIPVAPNEHRSLQYSMNRLTRYVKNLQTLERPQQWVEDDAIVHRISLQANAITDAPTIEQQNTLHSGLIPLRLSFNQLRLLHTQYLAKAQSVLAAQNDTVLRVLVPVVGVMMLLLGVVFVATWRTTSQSLEKEQRDIQSLQRERQFNEAVLQNAGALVVVLDRQGHIRRFNRAAEELSGFTFAEVEGKCPWETVLPADAADAIRKEVFERIFDQTTGKASKYINEWQSKDGSRYVIKWFNTLLMDADGQPDFTASIGVDITAHLQAQAALGNSQRNLAEAQRISKVGSWELDLINNVLLWSAEIYRIFEMDKASFDASYEAFLDAIHPDDREVVHEAYTNSLETGESYRIVHRLQMADGRIKWVAERGESQFDAQGKAIRSIGTVQDVTEQMRSNAELRLKDAIVSNLFAGAVTVRLDDGTIRYVNPNFAAMFGYEEEELIGQPASVLNAGSPEDARKQSIEIIDALRTRSFWQGDLQNKKKDGSTFWTRSSIVTIDHPEFGRVAVSVQEDITEQKKAEEALRASRNQLREILDSLYGFVGLYTLDGRVIEANRAPLEAAGVTREQVIGQPFWETYWWSYSPQVQDQLRKAMRRAAQGEIVRYDVPVRIKDGAMITIDVAFGPLRDERGNIVNIIGFGVDITERCHAQDTLRESERSYRTLFETSPDAIFIIDLMGRIRSANEAAGRMHGYTVDELLTMSIDDLNATGSEKHVPIRLEILKANPDGQSKRFQVNHRRKDGAVFPVEVVAAPVELHGEIFFLGIDRDISDRVQAETTLRESEERLRLALQAAKQGLYDLNLETGETIVSDEYAQMLGYDPADFRETKAAWIERLHPDDRDAVLSKYRDYVSGKTSEYQVEFRQHTRTGQWKWILSLGKIVVRDADGNPLRMLGTHTDISALKTAQAELRQRDRELMHATRVTQIGGMATAIAHEINQPLGVIANYSSIVLNGLRSGNLDGVAAAAMLEKICGQSLRAGNII
ncbi:MAG: PAS domain S-box protein, partial [Planctomycetota bacterium]|nr:PAS domain S-box protein [Planctomycetota bacterium]